MNGSESEETFPLSNETSGIVIRELEHPVKSTFSHYNPGHSIFFVSCAAPKRKLSFEVGNEMLSHIRVWDIKMKLENYLPNMAALNMTIMLENVKLDNDWEGIAFGLQHGTELTVHVGGTPFGGDNQELDLQAAKLRIGNIVQSKSTLIPMDTKEPVAHTGSFIQSNFSHFESAIGRPSLKQCKLSEMQAPSIPENHDVAVQQTGVLAFVRQDLDKATSRLRTEIRLRQEAQRKITRLRNQVSELTAHKQSLECETAACHQNDKEVVELKLKIAELEIGKNAQVRYMTLLTSIKHVRM